MAADPQTRRFYHDHAAECASRHHAAEVTSLHALLGTYCLPGMKVLDVGGGSGRDSAFLKASGCRVTFTDASPEMLAEGLRRHPELGDSCRVLVLPVSGDDPIFRERFDVVLLLAVIMHMGDGEFASAAGQVSRLVAPGGRLIVSHSVNRSGLVAGRDAGGRLFRERSPDAVEAVVAPFGFASECRHAADDGMGREGLRWHTAVFRRGTGGA